MTYTFTVQLDTHNNQRVSPVRLAKAIYRAIEVALANDIEGAEILDARIGQVSVRPASRG